MKKQQDRFLSTKEVCEMVGLSRSTVHRREKSGDFPGRRNLGNGKGWRGRVAYLESEIIDWMHSRETVSTPFFKKPDLVKYEDYVECDYPE